MITKVRIDDAVWDAAEQARRHDWRVSIADLVEAGGLGKDGDALLHITPAQNAILLATFDEHGLPRDLLEVNHAALREHIEEYLAIIRRIESGETNDSSSVMHTLDMAKKVVHDDGAKTLAEALPNLARDHEGYRRLFSLILSLVVDVTKLPGAKAHRRHA